MSQKHRNRTIEVLPPRGALLDVRFRVTPRRAARFIAENRATWVQGIVGGALQLIGAPPRNRAASVETAALAKKLSTDQELMGDVVRYVESRSAHRWAQRPRITRKRQSK